MKRIQHGIAEESLSLINLKPIILKRKSDDKRKSHDVEENFNENN